MQGNRYINARMKKLKIYTDEEINSPISEMEKKRRRFWNEKAEQVAKSQKTANLNKMAMIGIIDVAWTIRKTEFVEIEATKTLDEEKVMVRMEFKTKLKSTQKKETIPKNLDRMAAAHSAVENIDKDIQDSRNSFEKATSIKERNKYRKEYERKKKILDGAYTELKRAQEATAKSIKTKRKQLDTILKSQTDDN